MRQTVFWDDEVVAALLEERAELATDQSAERLDRDQKVPAGWMPGSAIPRDPAAGDQAVSVWMKFEALIPGVQHGEHANGTADITGITREFEDRPGGGLYQDGITVALMAA